MAEVDGIVFHPTASVNRRVGYFALTGATSTFGQATHSMNTTLYGVQFSWEGTNTLTWTRSGTTITLTGTNNDRVYFDVWGD